MLGKRLCLSRTEGDSAESVEFMVAGARFVEALTNSAACRKYIGRLSVIFFLLLFGLLSYHCALQNKEFLSLDFSFYLSFCVFVIYLALNSRKLRCE